MSSGLSDGSIAAIVIGILVIIIIVLFFVGIVGWYIASRGKKVKYIVSHRESHLSEPHYVQTAQDKNRTESVALQEASTGDAIMTYKNTNIEEDDASKSKQQLEDESGDTEEKMGEEKKMEEKEEVVGRERQDTYL